MEFIKCDKCGKKVIMLKDGLLYFKFGKRFGDSPPVDIVIDGDVEIKCLRNGCDNIIQIKKGEK